MSTRTSCSVATDIQVLYTLRIDNMRVYLSPEQLIEHHQAVTEFLTRQGHINQVPRTVVAVPDAGVQNPGAEGAL